ncbi:MAG: respiratory nitrate reductase subunit gamma [Leptolyngbya sp. RL_3_1]|nr:respiratory nitrate reductase subunit gamma [Leptolyngbya sp. RL_3_1]
MYDYLLFILLPYTAVTVLVVVSIYRFVTNKFSYSSLSPIRAD